MRVFFLPALFWVIWLAGCRDEETHWDPETLKLLSSQTEILDSVVIQYTDMGIKRLVITAPVMYRVPYRNQRAYQQIFPQTLHVDFFNADGEKAGSLDAGYGERSESEKTIIVRDKVVVMMENGDRLESPEMMWTENTHKITSDKPYKYTRPNGDFSTGFGFEANETFTEIKSRSVYNRSNVSSLQGRKDSIP